MTEQYEPPTLQESIDTLLDLHEVQKKYNLGIDVFRVREAFYEAHKQTNGSYKRYIGTGEWYQKTGEREDCLLNMVNALVEAKIRYMPSLPNMAEQEVLDKVI